ncbi:MAG TPA: hypothetical protein VMT89_14395 [Candidatus Acidoferrales bacterium]|nr:hypothetical protein [Candidatus Acidoferrales bacterium]
MGIIEPMAIGSAMWGTMVFFTPPFAVWAVLVGALAVATAGILLSTPRRPRPTQRNLRLAHASAITH